MTSKAIARVRIESIKNDHIRFAAFHSLARHSSMSVNNCRCKYAERTQFPIKHTVLICHNSHTAAVRPQILEFNFLLVRIIRSRLSLSATYGWPLEWCCALVTAYSNSLQIIIIIMCWPLRRTNLRSLVSQSIRVWICWTQNQQKRKKNKNHFGRLWFWKTALRCLHKCHLVRSEAYACGSICFGVFVCCAYVCGLRVLGYACSRACMFVISIFGLTAKCQNYVTLCMKRLRSVNAAYGVYYVQYNTTSSPPRTYHLICFPFRLRLLLLFLLLFALRLHIVRHLCGQKQPANLPTHKSIQFNISVRFIPHCFVCPNHLEFRQNDRTERNRHVLNLMLLFAITHFNSRLGWTATTTTTTQIGKKMDFTVFASVLVGIYIVLWFFDSFFKVRIRSISLCFTLILSYKSTILIRLSRCRVVCTIRMRHF